MTITDFDGIPTYKLHNLGRKQEETGRSMEKIEKGESNSLLRMIYGLS